MPNFLISILLLLTFAHAAGQKAYLTNGKMKVPLTEASWIGLTTTRDTIKYWGNKTESYYIVQTGKDSLVVRKPDVFADTVVLQDDLYAGKLQFDYRLDKYYKENKVRYCKIRKVLSYQTKTFAYKDLTTLTYPVYTGRLDGCIGCILVPGLNIWWLIDIKNRQEKTLKMTQWKVEGE